MKHTKGGRKFSILDCTWKDGFLRISFGLVEGENHFQCPAQQLGQALTGGVRGHAQLDCSFSAFGITLQQAAKEKAAQTRVGAGPR